MAIFFARKPAKYATPLARVATPAARRKIFLTFFRKWLKIELKLRVKLGAKKCNRLKNFFKNHWKQPGNSCILFIGINQLKLATFEVRNNSIFFQKSPKIGNFLPSKSHDFRHFFRKHSKLALFCTFSDKIILSNTLTWRQFFFGQNFQNPLILYILSWKNSIFFQKALKIGHFLHFLRQNNSIFSTPFLKKAHFFSTPF